MLAVRKRRRFPWDIGLLFVIGLAAAWGAALIRGSYYVMTPYKIYYPVARYALPMVIPTITLYGNSNHYTHSGWLVWSADLS
jgi:hypothetical protein